MTIELSLETPLARLVLYKTSNISFKMLVAQGCNPSTVEPASSLVYVARPYSVSETSNHLEKGLELWGLVFCFEPKPTAPALRNPIEFCECVWCVYAHVGWGLSIKCWARASSHSPVSNPISCPVVTGALGFTQATVSSSSMVSGYRIHAPMFVGQMLYPPSKPRRNTLSSFQIKK